MKDVRLLESGKTTQSWKENLGNPLTYYPLYRTCQHGTVVQRSDKLVQVYSPILTCFAITSTLSNHINKLCRDICRERPALALVGMLPSALDQGSTVLFFHRSHFVENGY